MFRQASVATRVGFRAPEAPGDRGADAGAHEVKPCAGALDRVGDREHVVHVLLYVISVDARRSGAFAEPAQIGCNDVKSQRCYRGNLMVPLPAVPRQPMQQEHERAIHRAILQSLEDPSACVDRRSFHDPEFL